MATRAQQAKVGIFLIVSAAIIVGGIMLLAGFDTSSSTRYRLKFQRSILGLSVGSPVVYLGVPVGNVTDIYVDGDGWAVVVIAVNDEKVTLYQGVHATMAWYSPVAGTMAIDLEGGEPGATTLAPNSFIPVKASLITSFAEVFESLLRKLDGSMDEITAIAETMRIALDGMEKGALTNVVTDVNALVNDTHHFVKQASQTLDDLDGRLERALSEFTALGEDLQFLADDVGDSIESADEFLKLAREKLEPLDLEALQANLTETFNTINELGTKVDSSLSNISDVGDSVVHEFDTIEHSLQDSLRTLATTIESVQVLVEDLQEDPASLLRGRGQPRER